MKRGPMSGLRAKGSCEVLCGSNLTGGEGIDGARLVDGEGTERGEGPDIWGSAAGPEVAGDADIGLGGGVPRAAVKGANMLGPGIPGDMDSGLGADSGRGGMVTGAAGTGTGAGTVVGAGAGTGADKGAVSAGNDVDGC